MLTTILIILLIISQLFCFYMIALLNAKVAKFKDLENRQEQIMREMEESISLYLVEIKEENDRLIKELYSKDVNRTKNLENANSIVDQIIEPIEQNNNDSATTTMEQRPYVPKTVAYNAYNKYKSKPSNSESSVNRSEPEVDSETGLIDQVAVLEESKPKKAQPAPLSFEQQVIKLHNEGKTIEQIAKLTNKGKTEIELLLKFQS